MSRAHWAVVNVRTDGILGVADTYAEALELWEICGRPQDVRFEWHDG